MDQTLANLLTTWWTTGDKDAALVLADRLHELPSEQVADVLLHFRNTISTLPALVDAIRKTGLTMAEAFRVIGTALTQQQQQQRDSPSS